MTGIGETSVLSAEGDAGEFLQLIVPTSGAPAVSNPLNCSSPTAAVAENSSKPLAEALATIGAPVSTEVGDNTAVVAIAGMNPAVDSATADAGEAVDASSVSNTTATAAAEGTSQPVSTPAAAESATAADSDQSSVLAAAASHAGAGRTGSTPAPAAAAAASELAAAPAADAEAAGGQDNGDFGDYDDASTLAAAEAAAGLAKMGAAPAAAAVHQENYVEGVTADTADAPGAPTATVANTQADNDKAGSSINASKLATAPAGNNSGEDDDEFGDFDDASRPAVLPPAQQTAAAGDGDDEFGDFDEASTSAATAAVAPAPPVAVAVPAQPAAAAAAEAPDILQLSGQDFLTAVLTAWEVLGAPACYQAVAARMHDTQSQQQEQLEAAVWMQTTAQLTQQGLNSISAARDNQALQQQQQQCLKPVTCPSDLEWQGSASQARLVAGMGLSQAVERALSQAEKDAAGAAAAAAGPGSRAAK